MPFIQNKICQVCEREFSLNDLYPNSLIRNSVLRVAKQHYPKINEEGFVCFQDLRRISALHSEVLLKQEKGALSVLEQEVIESLKDQDLLSENVNEEFEEKLTFGQKLSDKLATFGGSWTFLIIFGVVVFIWTSINSLQLFDRRFDPYPYILLNLVLSCVAAIQAPVIMMSQNRQAAKDRLQMEHDYLVNLKAELQVRQLNTRMELFMRHHWQKMHEIIRLQEEMIQDININADISPKYPQRPV